MDRLQEEISIEEAREEELLLRYYKWEEEKWLLDNYEGEFYIHQLQEKKIKNNTHDNKLPF